MSSYRTEPLNHNSVIIERRSGALKSLPAVIYCHGGADASGNSWDLLTNSGTGVGRNYGHEVFEAITEAGYRLVAPAVGAWWGATPGQDIIDDIYDDLVADGFPSTVHIFGGSNGGCLALNWFWRNPSKVASAFVFVPLVAVEDIYNGTPGFQASIQAAYGGVPSEQNYDDFDPARNHAAIIAQVSKLKVWYGTNDTILPAGSVQAFVSAVGCEYTETAATHFNGYEPTYWDRQEPVAWFNSHS